MFYFQVTMNIYGGGAPAGEAGVKEDTKEELGKIAGNLGQAFCHKVIKRKIKEIELSICLPYVLPLSIQLH